MLKYNFDRIMKARGIQRPFTYLKKAGFSDNFATRVKNNRINRLNLESMERLCILLRCTPNDLMEWIPESKHNIDHEHPINNIKKSNKVIDITKTLNSVPLGKLEEIENLINEKLRNN